MFNGSGTHSRDRETQTTITDFGGEKTINDCIRVRGDLSFTVSGGGTFEGHRMKVAGQWSGLQTNGQAGTLVYTVSDPAELPSQSELHQALRDTIHKLRRLAGAPVLRSFSGPALLEWPHV